MEKRTQVVRLSWENSCQRLQDALSFRTLLLVVSLTLLSPAAVLARQFHVTTTGSSSNSGADAAHAWSLSSAFGKTSLAGGDTVWIHGGTYPGGLNCSLAGSAGAPIVFRNYNNERVKISISTAGQTLTLSGSYIWIWGLEFYNTDAAVTTDEGFNVATVGSVNCKVINCIMHNALTNGIFEQANSRGTEVYGCIFYYNGRKQNNGKYGYGIYAQNAPGNPPKVYDNNILFNNYGNYPIHCYGDAGGTDSFYVKNNIVTGMLDRNCVEIGCEIEGTQSHGSRIDSNYIYQPFNLSNQHEIVQEYGGGIATPLERGNVIIGGLIQLNSRTTNRSFSGNTVYGSWPVISVWNGNQNTPIDTLQFPGNKFYIQSGIGYAYPSIRPPRRIIINQNRYEPSKFHIGVWNPDSSSSVSVDMSGRLATGTAYTVLDAQGYYAESDGSWNVVASGTYNGGSITLPMDGTAAPAWITPPQDPANPHPDPKHLDRKFGSFIVIGGAVAPPPQPSGTLSPSSDTLAAGGGDVTMTWSSQNATSATIDGSTVTLSGQSVYHLDSTHVFVLGLDGPGGSVTVSARVVVRKAVPPPKPSGTITASADTLPANGGDVTITWSSQNATSVTIDGESVSTSGHSTFHLDSTHTFFMALAGPGGTANASVLVYVPPTVELLPPPIPITPSPGGGGSPGTIRFTWHQPAGVPLLYWFEIAGDSNFTSSSVDSTLQDTTTVMTGLVMGHTYFWRVRGKSDAGWGEFCATMSIKIENPTSLSGAAVPLVFELRQNFPNPFNPSTSIEYHLTQEGLVRLRVFDVVGREVALLVNGVEKAGIHIARFAGNTLASGVYYCSLEAEGKKAIRRMLLVR